jgi:SAM-dependent methyltransferase
VTLDKSNGYERIAHIYISGRGKSHGGVGASEVAEWSRLLPKSATVLDLGCGPGVPISETLIDGGFQIYGVDASPSMVAAFQTRFPAIPVECAAFEDSDFFGRAFDGVVAWGLMFLLDAETQHKLIAKMAAALVSGGRLLFTAPAEVCSWNDAMTGQLSMSLGFDEYKKALETNGMQLVDTRLGTGHNHYYSALKYSL